MYIYSFVCILIAAFYLIIAGDFENALVVSLKTATYYLVVNLPAASNADIKLGLITLF